MNTNYDRITEINYHNIFCHFHQKARILRIKQKKKKHDAEYN